MLSQKLTAELQVVRQQQLYRQARIADSHALDFCSNDYLGLANHVEVSASLQRAVSDYGVGSTGSHLISGHHAEHVQLEEALADFTGREAALTFSTGYMANMGVLDALSKLVPSMAIYSDELNHASLIDGCRLSKATVHRYPHTDVTYLQQNNPGKEHLVVTDGLFSMDGDIAPLPDLANYAASNSGWLVVDDAHGLGVLGENGGGCCEHFGLSQNDVPVLIGTFGKAFGTTGAFVAGSRDLMDYLVQRARTYIYTTAQPPALAAATRVALHLLRTEQWRREHLQQLIQQFKQGANRLGLQLLPSNTPIQPLLLGSAADTMAWSHALQRKGMHVIGIRPPTVPAGTGRLRITLSAKHSAAEVDQLLTALQEVQQAMQRKTY